MITKQEKADLNEWCLNAVLFKLSLEQVKLKFALYPKEVRDYIIKTFKQYKKAYPD